MLVVGVGSDRDEIFLSVLVFLGQKLLRVAFPTDRRAWLIGGIVLRSEYPRDGEMRV